MTTEWRPVRGFEAIYAVSDSGQIRRVAGAKGAVAGRILTARPCKKGYLRVVLYNGPHRREASVHRLVAEAFLSHPSGKSDLNHKDGNKQNNAVSNLEWVTPAENMQHAMAHGLRPNFKGIANGRAKLTEENVRGIRSARGHLSNVALAEIYGVSNQLISLIQKGMVWKHV